MLRWYQQLFFRNQRLPFKCRVRYHLGHQPNRKSAMPIGKLCITKQGLDIKGIVDVSIQFDDQTELGFCDKYTKTKIMIKTPARTVYVMPRLFATLQLDFEAIDQTRQVYSVLHRLLGGPGLCFECKYDLRVSKGQCPDCGCKFVNPIKTGKLELFEKQSS